MEVAKCEYEEVHATKPLSFGGQACVHMPEDLHIRLDLKSRNCIFVEYSHDAKFGYHM